MRVLQPKLLERAAQIVGGEDRLRELLRVEAHALKMWMDGAATAPPHILHAVIDIILNDDLARAAQDRRSQPRVQTDSTGASGE